MMSFYFMFFVDLIKMSQARAVYHLKKDYRSDRGRQFCNTYKNEQKKMKNRPFNADEGYTYSYLKHWRPNA